jgi:hypothetical protein
MPNDDGEDINSRVDTRERTNGHAADSLGSCKASKIVDQIHTIRPFKRQNLKTQKAPVQYALAIAAFNS